MDGIGLAGCARPRENSLRGIRMVKGLARLAPVDRIRGVGDSIASRIQAGQVEGLFRLMGWSGPVFYHFL